MRRQQDPVKRRGGLALLLALVTATAGPALGTEEAAAKSAPPVFFIEKILIETQRLSPEIVLSESLLRDGREYDEQELREAVRRINQLPFVLLAEFSLEKGSQRDRYNLVVKVYETRRWFFQVGWDLLNDASPTARLDPRFDGGFTSRIGEVNDDFEATIGRRFAVGKRGLLFASFGSEDGAFALGYQQYNLFDRNVLLSISLGGENEIGGVTLDESSWSARAQLGIPIRDDHALRVLLGHRELGFEGFSGFDFDSRESEAELVWVFDSRDDPVLPRDGSLYEAGLTWSQRDDQRLTIDLNGEPFVFEIRERRTGVVLAAGHHWPVAAKQSFSASGRAFLADSSTADQLWETEISGGYEVFLKRRLERDRWQELRLETRVSWFRQDFSAASDFPSAIDLVDSWRGSVGLVYRNGWGLVRFALSYLDQDFE